MVTALTVCSKKSKKSSLFYVLIRDSFKTLVLISLIQLLSGAVLLRITYKSGSKSGKVWPLLSQKPKIYQQ